MVRTTAAMALVQIRPLVPEVVSVLLDWPDEESWRFQDWEPDIPSVRELKREFKDDYPNIEAKSWALASCGRCVVPRLLTANRYLSDASNGWPCRGVFWLLRRDARAVVPMLIAGLHHEDPRVREVAAVGLGALERRAAAAVPALQQAAGDPSHEVQDQAREALIADSRRRGTGEGSARGGRAAPRAVGWDRPARKWHRGKTRRYPAFVPRYDVRAFTPVLGFSP